MTKKKEKPDVIPIIQGLAALFYYDSRTKNGEKKISFENLQKDDATPFLELSASILSKLDQLNLRVVQKEVRNEKEIEDFLKSKIEATVRKFFQGIEVWKKDLIPQQELVERIYQIWETL